MLSDLPFELVDAIAQFLSYRDLVSLKLTCKNLKEHVEFVKVRYLNVFVDSLHYEGKLFHSNEPISYAESMAACPKRIFSRAFQDRFRYLKRLTFHRKPLPYCVFILEQDLNCFQELEHLELRAFTINEGGCLKLNQLRVLLVEMVERARYVVDCEQLTGIHFTHTPEIVHTDTLRHVSFINMVPKDFVKFCKKCPNLTRLTLSSFTFDCSLSPSNSILYEVVLRIISRSERTGLICNNKLRCLERIEINVGLYLPYSLLQIRETIRHCEEGEPGKEVYERLKFHVGSQDLLNDEKFDELLNVINDQFEEFENPSLLPIKKLSLTELTYSDLAKFQRPMEDLIPSLRHISIDKKLKLASESLLYRLANLRQLLIKGNRLDETILNQFTRQFRYLELLGFVECAIYVGDPVLPRNHSVHLLMIENCTCSDLNFLKSFENVKHLYLFKLKQEQRLRSQSRSIRECRQSLSSILKSLSCLEMFGLETLGKLCIFRHKIVLLPEIASTIEEMKQSFHLVSFVDENVNNFVNDNRGSFVNEDDDFDLPNCLNFRNFDEFIEYACRI